MKDLDNQPIQTQLNLIEAEASNILRISPVLWTPLHVEKAFNADPHVISRSKHFKKFLKHIRVQIQFHLREYPELKNYIDHDIVEDTRRVDFVFDRLLSSD